MINDKDKFAIELDVSQFRPEELSVKVTGEELIIEGHHEERSDECGKIQRDFIRKYALPKDVDSQSIQSELTNQGILRASAKKSTSVTEARNIPIKAAPPSTKSLTDDESKVLKKDKET